MKTEMQLGAVTYVILQSLQRWNKQQRNENWKSFVSRIVPAKPQIHPINKYISLIQLFLRKIKFQNFTLQIIINISLENGTYPTAFFHNMPNSIR